MDGFGELCREDVVEWNGVGWVDGRERVFSIGVSGCSEWFAGKLLKLPVVG